MRPVALFTALLALAAPTVAFADPATDPTDRAQTPGRAAVVSAMQALYPGVAACGAVHGQHGTVSIRLVFASDGHLVEAVVPAPYEGTPIAACFVEATRGARLPMFVRPTFTVNFPFRF